MNIVLFILGVVIAFFILWEWWHAPEVIDYEKIGGDL